MKDTFQTKLKKDGQTDVITVPAGGKLACKVVYFVGLDLNSKQKVLCQSIKQMVKDVIKTASDEN